MPIVKDRLYIRIKSAIGRAIGDFDLISEGDRIAVAVSGGKDSYTLLHVLNELRQRAPIRYELVAVNIDSGYPGYRADVIESHLREHGFAFHLEKTVHYDIIREKARPGSSICSLCARLKRGALYGVVQQLGCNKLALGHHADDFIETLLLNQFFVGSLKAMSAKMLADNGQTTVIRPMVYVPEADTIAFARACAFPIVTCNCPGCEVVDTKRKRMKALLKELEKEYAYVKNSLLNALANVQPRHLLDLTVRKERGETTTADDE